MKRIRQLIAFFLSAVLLLSVLPVGVLAAEDSAASPSVSQAEEAGAPSENTEDSPVPTEDTDSAEEAQPADDTSDESTPAETEGTEETEASAPQDGTAEDTDFSQTRFLEEYAAAASYTLDQSLVLTSDLTLDHEIRIPAGGEILVPDNVTLTVSGKLTIDGGTVKVLSGGELVLESGGSVEVLHGLLSVSIWGSFVNRAGADAISVSQGSGTVEGIELAGADAPAELDAADNELQSDFITALSTDDYRDWAYGDSRWSALPLGTGGETVGSAGCLVTAATKLMIQAGLKNADSCNVGTFVSWANSNSGFLSSGMYWNAPDRFAGFTNQGHLLEGTYTSSAYNDQIISWIKQGFHMVIGVNGNGHWVAVDEAQSLRTGTVYIWDSGSADRTNITLAGRYSTFSTVHAWTGGTTPSTASSFHLDLNGFLDGKAAGNIYGYGTADIYINGALDTPNASDFYKELPIGTTYEIKNIQAASGYKYNGVYSGSPSGVIGSNDVAVVLSFSTLPFCKITYENSSGKTEKTVSPGEYTVAENYDKKDNFYFIGWSYKANAEMFDVRPGEKINVTEDITLYPVYISHEDAVSGKPVLIYNISDFPADGYSITETTKEVSSTTTESGWGDWSGWSTTAVSGSDTVQVESRTAYGWYYYQCPSCGAHMHGYGTCYTWAGGCGASLPDDGGHPTYLSTSWDTAQDWYGTGKYYATIDGAVWFRWDDGGTQTQYRSRQLVTNTATTRKTYKAYIILPETIDTITVSYNANGGTGAPASQVFAAVPDGWTSQQIPGQEVLETKTQYRSRTKTVQASAEKNLPGWTLISSEVSGYGAWSDWTATPITADEDTEVRTQEVPATYKTVWHYSRDTANGYSTYVIGYYGNPEYITLDYRLTAKGTVDGHTHYGSYGTTLVNYWWNEESESVVDQAAYTAYSSRPVYHVYRYYKWSDWTEYADTPVTASDTVEVQTRTVYRYAAGVKISDTVPVRSGYTFLGWAATASATTAAYQPGELFVPSADTTLYAVWKQVTYTVSYDANGGTGAPAGQTKTHGTALTLSSAKPTRASTSAGSCTVTLNGNGGTVTPGTLTAARTTGYTFKNWNTAANGSGTGYASGASYTADAAVTLYAQWNSSTSTASVTLPTPTRTGWTFRNWNTKADGTGTAYDAKASYTPSGNVTLYAIWKQVTYTVSYDANGGTGAPAGQTKTHGTALTLSSAKPTRASTSAGSCTVTLNGNGGTVTPGTLTAARTTGYTFKNWNTAANGSGTGYASGASYTADAAVTLYAQWNSSTSTASVTLPTPTRTGWTFRNWNTKADGTGTAYDAKASYTPSGNVTLYAIWQQDQETVGTLSLGTASGSAGSEVVLDVKLDRNPGIMALNFFFDYDKSKLEFLGGEEGTLTGWTFSTKGNGALWDSDADCTDTGTIARLRFKILEGADEGTVSVVLRDLLAGNYADQEIHFAAVSGKVTIRNRIPGDMTGDGKVNIMDLIRLRKHLAGDSVDIDLSNADVTGDGKVNVMDLIRLRKYLAGDDVELV